MILNKGRMHKEIEDGDDLEIGSCVFCIVPLANQHSSHKLGDS